MIQRRLLFLRKFSLLFKQFVAYVKGDGGVVESVDYLYGKFTQAPNASILQIPTSYKTSVLYNQEPLNYSEDFDVIRNSAVFRTAPNGLLEEIGVNVPCIDYATGEPLLLTQPQSTNLIQYSEDFSQGWILTQLTGVPNSGLSPSGNNNAFNLIPSTSNAQHKLVYVISSTNQRTISIFAKQNGYAKFRINTGSSGDGYADFNLENGTIPATGGTFFNNAKIEPLPNDWYRCSMTINSGGGTSNVFAFLDDTLNTTTFSGDGISGILFWGAQTEEQPFATSYIPTNGSVATRLQDQIVNAGSTDTINSEQGVLYFEGAALTNVEGVAHRNLSLSDGTGDNRLLWKYDDTSNRVQFFYRKNLVNLGTITVNNVNVLEINSFALVWNEENLYAYVNESPEGQVSLSDTFSANTLNTLSFNTGSGSSALYAKTKELRVYKSIAEAQIDLPYIT
jgi:hypothetical protein